MAKDESEKAPRREPKNETAWMLDEGVAIGDDGGAIAGLPGLWRPGEAVHPDVLGMSVSDFRDVVERLSLPLVEVSVRRGSSAREFSRADATPRFASSVLGAGPLAPVETELSEGEREAEAAAAAHAVELAVDAADTRVEEVTE